MKKLISLLLSTVMAVSAAGLTGGKDAGAAYSAQSYSYSYSSSYSSGYSGSGSSSSSSTKVTRSQRQYYVTTTTTTTTSAGSYKKQNYSSTTQKPARQKYLNYLSVENGKKIEDRMVYLKKSNDLFTVSNSWKWYFYHMSKIGVTGIGINGDQFHSSGYGQLYAKIENNRYLTVKFNSIKDDIVCKNITMTLSQNKNAKLKTNLNRKKSGSLQMTLGADLYDQCFVNGIYKIDAEYTFKGRPQHCQLYMFVNCKSDRPSDYEFYICYGEQRKVSDNFSPAKRRNELTDLLASEDVTISKALNPDVIYPFCANRTNSDTKFWRNKSHEILDKYGNINAGRKLLILHDWMTSNMKYDYYKVNVLKYPRYFANGVLNTMMYLSKNNTGVCLDFSCIFAIMCREAGIPCVVLNNTRHAWNAAYISGDGWIELDLTVDVNRFVYGSDLKKVTGNDLYCYSGFATFDVNDCKPDTAVSFCF